MVPGFIEFDSPFEEEVYKMLTERGYKVDTQVGCSGYRIDLAVRHPDKFGYYVLGIEYDGATYHSARTARERDRLREDVLIMRGWKIHRIWSTDWIKDPVFEMNRLIKAIEEAYEECSLDDENFIVGEQYEVIERISSEGSSKLLNIETLIDENSPKSNDEYCFCEYKEADIYSIDRKEGQDDWSYLGDIIKHVVNTEGPIHFECLSRRVVPIFGKAKAGSQIKRTIQYAIENYCNGLINLKGDFCWLSNMEFPTVRIPEADESPRPIEFICTEERAEAMYSVVKKAVGINMDDLFVETARIFGFSRTGGKIQLAMLEAMEYLKDSGRIRESNNYINVVDVCN